jgi:hypothetical protein
LGLSYIGLIMKNIIWLPLSLFCSKKDWGVLLNEGIVPFLEELSAEQKHVSYFLEFNSSQGENIRLSLATENANAPDLAKRADTYFKDFFSRRFIPEKENLLPAEVKDLFMPFPKNSIQYGVYKSNDAYNNFSAIRMALSAIMIDALIEETINDETIWTFAYYLNLALLKALGKHRLSKFKNFYNVNDEINSLIISKFTDNRETLIEIANNIIHSQTVEDTSIWLESWTKTCEGEIMNDFPNFTKLLEIHNRIVDIIYKQVGVTEKMRVMLFYFISQVI